MRQFTIIVFTVPLHIYSGNVQSCTLTHPAIEENYYQTIQYDISGQSDIKILNTFLHLKSDHSGNKKISARYNDRIEYNRKCYTNKTVMSYK